MVVELISKNFDDEVVNASGLIVVDFWAPWCGPCQIIGPIVEELSQEFKDNKSVKFAKLNVDENPGIAQKYGIMNIPVLKFFKKGDVVDEIIGVKPKEEIVEKIDGLIAN